MPGQTSRQSRTSVGAIDGDSAEPREIAGSICAVAYKGGKNGGPYAATLAVLPRQLKLPMQTIEQAVIAGENWGWLRRLDGRVELTASGLYTAKQVLNLPT